MNDIEYIIDSIFRDSQHSIFEELELYQGPQSSRLLGIGFLLLDKALSSSKITCFAQSI